jgi:hypothetical protein
MIMQRSANRGATEDRGFLQQKSGTQLLGGGPADDHSTERILSGKPSLFKGKVSQDFLLQFFMNNLSPSQ